MSRVRRVDGEGEARFGCHFQALEGEGELSDGRVAEPFGAGAVVPDIVGAPAGAEFLTAGGQLADEIAQAVLWLCSDGAGYVSGIALPVDGGYVAQ